jgi:hypothetical protein
MQSWSASVPNFRGIDLPAQSTEVQSNHRKERSANDICGFIPKFFAMSAKKDGHNSMNHGYEQDESKK